MCLPYHKYVPVFHFCQTNFDNWCYIFLIQIEQAIELCKILYVCADAGYSTTDHNFLASNTFSLVEWSLGNEKETFFLFFELSNVTLLIDIFSYVTLVKFSFPATSHSFSSRNVKFWLRRPCTNRILRIFCLFVIPFIYFFVKWVLFPFLVFFLDITMVIIEISMACDLSF